MAIERLQFLCEKPREQSTEDYQTDQYAKPHLVRLQLVGLHVHPGRNTYRSFLMVILRKKVW